MDDTDDGRRRRDGCFRRRAYSRGGGGNPWGPGPTGGAQNPYPLAPPGFGGVCFPAAAAPWLAGKGAANAPGGDAAGAEITPLAVDPSLTFDQVGGLAHYVHSLKEMVFLPLLYPEVFSRFKMSPPRGVLLYGAPGTGKTLIARALAASCSRAGAEVSFFMRKGADG